jgi:hypothetical protein
VLASPLERSASTIAGCTTVAFSFQLSAISKNKKLTADC